MDGYWQLGILLWNELWLVWLVFFILNCTKNILNSFLCLLRSFVRNHIFKTFLRIFLWRLAKWAPFWIQVYISYDDVLEKREIFVRSLHHFTAFLVDFKEYNVLPSRHMWGPVKTDKSCGTNVADCDPTSNFPCCSAGGKCVWTCSGSTSVDFRFPYSKFTIKLNFQKLRHVYLFTCMVFYFFPVSFESLLYWYVSKWYYQKSKRVLNEREWKHLVLIDTHFT